MHSSTLAALILVALVYLPAAALAQAETDTGAWASPRSISPLYEHIAEDLKQGRPLIIVGYYGMWATRSDDPDRNLHWGVRYGHKPMLERANTDLHIKRNYQHTNWRRVHSAERDEDPLRVLVFQQTIKPNKRWKDLGVDAPFEVYLVMEAWQSQAGAAVAMTRNLRMNQGRQIKLEGGATIDTGAAHVTGYSGHNLFYDYANFQWSGLDRISGSVDHPRGVFAVGCNTARVPGFGRLITENVFALLFSRSLMATEGYSTLAIADGVVRALDSEELVKLGDRTYQYFQKLAKPDRKVGRPFVSHGYRMYE